MAIKERINGIIIKSYNAAISSSFINKRNRVCRKIRAMLYHNICFGCHARFGNLNPNRTFYVIRCPKSDIGFFGLYNYVVNRLRDALAMNAEPVVDWQYYPNDYLLEDGLVGRVNAWEYFFKPMSNVSLSEVYRSKNVIMSDSDGRYENTLSETENAEKLLRSSRLIGKYIVLNEDTQRVCDNEYYRLNMDKFRVLGVKLRGTDFKETKPKGHSICPDVEHTVRVIEEKMAEWGEYDRIFIATEDDSMFEQMKRVYGNRLLYNETLRFGTVNGKWLKELFDEASGEEDYKRSRMLEYLVSVYLLARCDALIAPIVGATLGAMRIKGRYEHHYLIRLGNYD